MFFFADWGSKIQIESCRKRGKCIFLYLFQQILLYTIFFSSKIDIVQLRSARKECQRRKSFNIKQEDQIEPPHQPPAGRKTSIKQWRPLNYGQQKSTRIEQDNDDKKKPRRWTIHEEGWQERKEVCITLYISICAKVAKMHLGIWKWCITKIFL